MPTDTTNAERTDGVQQPLLEARDVEKGFDDGAVLEGLDLTVEKGELVTLMGPNGVGKSVFLSCLAGSTAPERGEIELFGDRSPTEARSATSVMLQGETIDPDLTGRENLQFYGDLHPRATDDWRALVDRLELTPDLDRPAREYSGGMRRKLELAIALTVDADLYLLDEPTAELDLAMIQIVHDLLLEYREAGKTILVTSHAPLDAQIADRIAFVRDGRTVTTGAPTTLLEALPPVVRIRGAMAPESLFLGDRVFQRGDEIRGFLASETDLTAIENAVEGAREGATVDPDPPSYTDLFNYYTYVQSARGDATRGVGSSVAEATDSAGIAAEPSDPEEAEHR
ncbi:ABC-type transport system ATP-binding protein [Haloterrigena salina JCM 13891]|uniref:ABC-type transport system ATP-binding protein n=1 Tax=Haloterrigena salina JCM 13891 TaxID=1227488 RepID=M0BQS9_9EURY|nr:ABC transporter ATP-binding protein [Haloterrigena salina]ELZ12758.1 ABC-type transport system ATP-binding protein [Haloterrigena salina JCM 13891]